MSVKATVFIPTLDGGGVFRNVMNAVREQELDGGFEVLVIDSGSRDGTDRVAAEAGARVLSIQRSEFNHGNTRNRGVQEARGEFVALITQDAMPTDARWLGRLVHAVEDVPGAAGAYCRQIPRPDADPFIRDRLSRWAAMRSERRVQEISDPDGFWALAPLDRLDCIAFDNVASCVRKSVLAEFPFAERSFGEDVAWSLKVLLAGYKIVFEPSAAVVHSHNEGLWESFRRVYMDHQNLCRLLGLSLVPGWKSLIKRFLDGIGFYSRIVTEAEGLSPVARLGWRLYGVPYGTLQVLAQYLGPRSNRWCARSGLYRRLDRMIVRRG